MDCSMTETKRRTVQTKPLTEAASGALEARGLDVELLARFGVESIVNRRSDESREWIAVPHVVAGEVATWAYRTVTGDKDFYQQAGGRRCFWNADVLSDSSLYGQDLIITEGQLDGLTCVSVGFPATVSVCDGAPNKPVVDPRSKYSYVIESLPLLAKFRSIVLAVDGDPAGLALMDDLARIIGRVRCRWLRYPAGCKDPNDVLVKYGPSVLVELIANAPAVEIPGLYTLSSLPPVPEWPAIACGRNGIDDLWRFRRGENTILLGHPASGKSVLLNDIAVALGKIHDTVTCWFSPEQPYQTTHVRRLMHCYLGKPPRLATEIERKRALEWIDGHNVWIDPPDDVEPTPEWLGEKQEEAAIRHNVTLMVTDPMNELLFDRPIGVRDDEYLGAILRKSNQLCRRIAAHHVMSVHPPKQRKNKDGRYDPPDGYEVAGGAMYFNKAFQGLTLHRPADTNEAQLINWKAKFSGDDRGYSRRGEIVIAYNAFSGRFDQVQTESGENDELVEEQKNLI
jgi:twinkle protein